MAETIDSLQISINASANDAADGIEKLRSTLEALKSAVGRGAGLTSVGNGMNKINTALSGVAGKLGTFNAFIDSLRNLTLAGKEKISSGIANQLNAISGAAGTISPAHVSNIVGLSSALHSLSAVPKGNVNSLVNALGKAPAALSGLNGIQWTQAANDISKLITALRPLETMGKTQGFTGTVSALARIPKIVDMLDENQLRRFDDALKSVASSMERVSVASGGLNIAFRNMTGASRHANGLAKSISNVDARTRNWNIIGILRGASQFLVKTISMTNEYVEDMNLFTVAMGEYADSAQKYAKQVSEIMGIDPAAWMRNQGIFMTLADGFGVTSERAAVMSRNLTQLGYDLSSFFNISSEDAMQKLQSGISGELEPLRRLGFDLSDARLKAIAYSLGIDKATASMNQAEKAQLRYYAIMTQVTSAQGDMARTLSAPSNQIRVFQAQLTMAGRAIGSIFIPALNAILPIATAVMQAIRGVATAIASLFGYSLPEVSYTAGLDSVTEGANNAATGLGNAAGAAKKLKNYLMGFDELNVIPDQSSGGGGGSGGAGGGTLSGFDFELPEYDFLADAVESNVDRIYRKIEPVVEWIKDNLDTIGSLTLSVGGALASLAIAKSFVPDINLGISALNSLKSAAAGVAAIGIMVGLVYMFDAKALETGDPWQFVADGLTTLFGSILTGEIAKGAAEKAGYSGAGVNSFVGGVSFMISAATSLSVMYDGAKERGFDGRVAALGVMSVIKTAIGSAMIASAFGLSVTGGLGLGLVVGAGVTAIVALDAILPDNTVSPNFGDIEWSAAEIRSAVESLYTFPVNATVSLVKAELANIRSATERVNSAIAIVESSLVPLRFGVAMEEDGLNSILSASNALIEEFNALDESRKTALNVAISVSPLLNREGADISGEAVGMFGQASQILQEQMAGLGADIAYWVEQGAIDGMEDLAAKMIGKLSTEMLELSAAFAQGEAIGKFESGIANTLSNMDAASFTGFLKEYATMREEFLDGMTAGTQETIISARAYESALRTAGKNELASAMAELAESISIEETRALAESNAVPTIRNEVLDGMRAIFTESFDASMGDFVGSFGLRGYLEDAFLLSETDIDTLASEVNDMLNEVLTQSYTDEERGAFIEASNMFGITGWDLLSADIQSNLYDALSNALDAERTDAVFKSLGYSVPGAIQNGVNEGGPIEVDIEAKAKFSGNAGKTGLGIAAGNLASSVLTQVAAAQTQIDAVVSSSEAASKEVESAWSGTASFIQTDVIQPIENGFTGLNWNALGRDAARGLRSGLMSIKIPNFSLSWSTKQKSFSMFGKEMTLQVPLPSIKFYAGGGFPSDGELFVANENGAQELVGRIGNRSAVANQDQIGDAIFQYMDEHDRESGMTEEGIATAMVSAMRAAGLGATYIDGRQLAQAINRESQRAGKPALDY